MAQIDYPEWLNASYFENILKTDLKNSSVKLNQIEVEPCGAGKDGFMSLMLRVKVKFTVSSSDDSGCFIVKMSPANELAAGIIGAEGFDVQNKEMLFYEVVAPRIEKILKSIGEESNVIPKAVFIDREHDAIVFEDLKKLNFVMADRMVGLDENHVKLSLTKLAKFHAASLVIYQKHPKVFDSFDVGFFSRKVEGFNNSRLEMLDVVVEEISTWKGFEHYANKLKKLKENFIENGTKCFDIAEGDFCVLNHGDSWTNNVMFNYGDDKNVNNAIMVRKMF
jgi:hypothetical protein